jgi:cytochrome c
MAHDPPGFPRPDPHSPTAAELTSVVLALALLLGLAPVPPPTPADPALQRGAWVAFRDCGQCHAIGLDDVSPDPDAPTFRQLRLRFNPIALERRLHPMPASGHFEMPPQSLTAADVPDLVAYIQSLTPRK